MKRSKMFKAAWVVLLVAGIANVYGYSQWENTTGNNQWTTGGNWSGEGLPGSGTTVYFNNPWANGRAVVSTGMSAYAGVLAAGHNWGTETGGVNSGTAFDVTGGSLEVTDLYFGDGAGSVVQHIDISGGSLIAYNYLLVGRSGANVDINLSGGELICGNYYEFGPQGNLNISGSGLFKIWGTDTGRANYYIGTGNIGGTNLQVTEDGTWTYVQSIPEPMTMVLLGLGGLFAVRSKK